MTVGLEGGAENVGLAGGGRTHGNRGQETGRDPRQKKAVAIAGRNMSRRIEAGGAGLAWPEYCSESKLGLVTVV